MSTETSAPTEGFKRRQFVAIVNVRDDSAIHWTWIEAVNKTTVRLRSTPESMPYLNLFALDGSEYDQNTRKPRHASIQDWRLRPLRDGDKQNVVRYQALRRIVLAKRGEWDKLTTDALLHVSRILTEANQKPDGAR